MTENENETVRVCIAHEQWRKALAEIDDTPPGMRMIIAGHRGRIAPGFTGTASNLASFMLSARERFGPYDSEMLARSVLADPIYVTDTPPEQQRYEFIFPGLELY